MPLLSLEKQTTVVGAAMLGGATLGVTSVGAAVVIASCAVSVAVRFLQRLTLQRASVWCLLFLGYCILSGVIFGGLDALGQTSFLGWIANEGRVFLYYWPALFVFEAARPSERGTCLVIRLLIAFVFANTLLTLATGISTFGTHHAAGAFAAMLVIFQGFRWAKTRHVLDFVFLALAIITLLGSNSRTALLAVFVSILCVTLSLGRIRQVVTAVLAVPALIAIMSIVFPYQFDRLKDAANATTLVAVRDNFQLAFSSTSPIEVTKAWELSENISLNGNANLAIRGYLFGRAFGEFMRSPIVGIGFGRFNDLGRSFSGTKGLFYPVTDVRTASPTDQTAHNSYLQVFTELGILGAVPLLMLYGTMWRGLKNAQTRAPEWSKTGRACLICIALMALTQHAFGAPIYGLSLFLLAAICYRNARAATD